MTREERLRYWQGIINKQKESDLSGAAFCKEYNINAGRFYYWRRRVSDGNDFNEREGGFLELIPCGSANNRATINVQLPNGILIESKGNNNTSRHWLLLQERRDIISKNP